jgi:hypothetical protein
MGNQIFSYSNTFLAAMNEQILKDAYRFATQVTFDYMV